ncbi:MAG: preprotein translocase subunit SecG [Bacteroidales bacterium]|nr:preprotein translocase subunit SecG [Bacteroidales bacterium]
MYLFVIILILVVCALLAGAVLIQNSKGGGLAANFSAPNQIMGVRKTTETIEKITWIMAACLIVLSIIATAMIKTVRPQVSGELKTEVTVDNTNLTNIPANTVQAGAAQQATPATEAPAPEAPAN